MLSLNRSVTYSEFLDALLPRLRASENQFETKENLNQSHSVIEQDKFQEKC